MKNNPLAALLIPTLIMTGSTSKLLNTRQVISSDVSIYSKSLGTPNPDTIYINDDLEEHKECREEEKGREIINKNLFVNFRNEFYSTMERSWFFKPNNKGLPPEEPADVIQLLKANSGYYVGDTNQKELYLTFDEGYENGYTNDMLDVLKKHDVKAAFFVVEPYIKNNPDIIKRMVEEGHLVCNHSAHHPSMAKVRDFDKFKKELGEVEDLFKEIAGKDMPRYFRPPMGRYSELSLHYTKDLSYKSVFWSLAYYDWDPKKQPNADEAKKLLLKRTHNGSIVLLHAVSKTNHDILDDLITAWKSEGYTLKSLNELP